MKTELQVAIVCQDENAEVDTMTMRLDLEFAPVPSVKFYVPPWSEDQLPESVTYDVEQSVFCVRFADERFPTKRKALERIEELRRYHWLPLGVDQRAETLAWSGPVKHTWR